MWRAMGGKKQFMGIVQKFEPDDDSNEAVPRDCRVRPGAMGPGAAERARAFFKLDDPRGELDGPGHFQRPVAGTIFEKFGVVNNEKSLPSCLVGHFMCIQEAMTEMSCYDGSPQSGPRSIADDVICVASKNQAFIDGLLPTDPIFTEHYEEFFPFELDEKYGVIARVRSGDKVGIAYAIGAGLACCPPRKAERFDLDVICVTSNGLICATPMHALGANPDIKEGDVLCFGAQCVLAVKHDDHWK